MEKLQSGAEKLGLKLSEKQLSLFQTYYEEIIEWNKRMNLTAITDYDKAQINHFLDSLTLVLAWKHCTRETTHSSPTHPPDSSSLHSSRMTSDMRVIDIGTGAGVPGIPLKIAFPEIQLYLLDSTGKKTIFLNHVKQKLGFDDINVVNGRAEEVVLRAKYREQFDLVLARGLAPLPTLVELTLPFCKIGGKLVAHKKGDIVEELKDAKKAVFVLGGKQPEVIPVVLEEFPDGRCLVVVNKVTHTPKQYPRASGKPVSNPIT